MTPSFSAIAETAISDAHISIEASEQQQDGFAVLVNAIQKQQCIAWIIEAAPYDKDAQNISYAGGHPGGVATDALSSFGPKILRGKPVSFLATTHDHIASDDEMHVALKQPYNFSVSGYTGDTIASARDGAGVIELLNMCGELDHITCYAWEGADITIKAGVASWHADDFIPVYKGVVQSIRWTETLITLNLKDRATRLNQPLLRNIYSGLGGLEGNSTLANKPKPLTFGYVQNTSPILVDANALIYQVHDGAIDAVSVVRDGGVELSYAGDVADIYAASIPFGAYVTDLSKGLFRLGAQPVFDIAADVRGSVPYVSSTVDIIRRVMASYTRNPIPLDEENLVKANIIFPYQIGIYIKDEMTVSALLDTLCQSAFGYWSIDRLGALGLHFIRQPRCQEALTLSEEDITSYKHINAPDILYKQDVTYAQNWSPTQYSNIAASVDEDLLLFLLQSYSVEAQEDDFVLHSHQASKAHVLTSLLQFRNDANSFADELLSLRSERRHVYEVVIPLGLFAYNLGDELFLDIERYKLNTRCLTVTGIKENASTMSATLTLLG